MAVFGKEGAQIAAAATVASMLGTIAASNALGVPLLGRRFTRATVGALRAAFSDSRLGEWTARRLTSRHAAAAADLFVALPKALRHELRDLPAVVAQQLR